MATSPHATEAPGEAPGDVPAAIRTLRADHAGDDNNERATLTGPVTTLRVTVGVLSALSLLFAVIAGSATVLLTAFGVAALVPLVLGAVIRTIGWRGRRVEQAERDEDAAIVVPVAALCWQPVVILSDLREQIFHGGAVVPAAGIVSIALAAYCTRR